MSLTARWLERAAAEVQAAVPVLNAHNLFPVADADTGTNMLITLKAAAVGASSDDIGGAARAALVEAVGNSGVILSELLHGLAQSLDEGWAAAWIRADELAQRAVVNPAPGTILSVSAAVAQRARELSGVDDGEVVSQLWQAAREAALATAENPPIAAAQGTVDAGAHGLERVIGALAVTLNGGECTPLPVPDSPAKATSIAPAPTAQQGMSEVMYLLEECSVESADKLRARLNEIGDSVLVVGSEALWNVHVHCVDVAAAIEAGLAQGRPQRIRITSLQEADKGSRSVVVVSNGPGLTELLKQCGAVVIDAFDRRPETQDFVAAAADAREAILMPHSRASAQAAAAAVEPLRQAGVRVSVLPTRSPVQVLSALAVHDAASSFDDDLVSMTGASSQTRYATIAIAKRDALTTVGPCKAGDVLGLIGGDVLVIGNDVTQVSQEVVSRFVATGGELLTLVRGADAQSELTSVLIKSVRTSHPEIEIQEIDGGQLYYPLLIGLE